MTREEFEAAIAELVQKTTHSKPRRNRADRRVSKDLKDTKLYNGLVDAGYTYRSKWVSEYLYANENDGEYALWWHRKRLRIKNIRGTGLYIKGCRAKRRRDYKRLSAKRFRRCKMDAADGNFYRRVALDLDWTLY